MLNVGRYALANLCWCELNAQRFLSCAISFCVLTWFSGAVTTVTAGNIDASEAATLRNQVIAGAYAKMLCSGIFISGREQHQMHVEDLWWLGMHDARVDHVKNTVSVIQPDGNSRVAIYTGPERGCVLFEKNMRVVDINDPSTKPRYDPSSRQERVKIPRLQQESHDAYAVLQTVVDQAFEVSTNGQLNGSRSIMIVHKDRVVVEKYAPGFSASTRLPGYSLTKGVTNSLVGILVGQGALSLDSRPAMAEWSRQDDSRRDITVDQLLHMTSGLRWYENYTDLTSDVYVMLATKADFAAYAANMPANTPPGMVWEYSTGSTCILGKIIRNVVEKRGDDYVSFPRRALFDRIGMSDAVLESDESGTFNGGTSLYATTEDWARLGLLYLHDGVGPDGRVLPEDWVAYTTRRQSVPASESPDFGALFWLVGDSNLGSDFPEDIFFGEGFGGQYIFIVPSRKLVIVRLGFALPDTWDAGAFLRRVLSVLPK